VTGSHAVGGVVPHKLRVRPEDFEVEELTYLVPATRGPYRLYTLTKVGWNTTDALASVARRFGLPRGAIAFGGRKDRHARTVQFVTVGADRDVSVVEEGFQLEPAGFVDEPMGPAAVRGNAFRITLREVRPADAPALAANAAALAREGVPNYFDDQRFGSFHPDHGFIGKMLVERRWEDALKGFLALPWEHDPAATKARKAAFRDNWWRWQPCLEHAATPVERHVFAFLARRGADYLAAINLLPRDDVSMALSAYQSHLWNAIVSRLLAELASATVELAGRVAPYRFPLAMSDDARAYLNGLLLPTPAARAAMPDASTETLYAALIAEERITPRSLRLRELRHAYLKSTPRAVMLHPADFSLAEPQADDLFPGRLCLGASFTLPRGAYATMVLRRLVLAAGTDPNQ